MGPMDRKRNWSPPALASRRGRPKDILLARTRWWSWFHSPVWRFVHSAWSQKREKRYEQRSSTFHREVQTDAQLHHWNRRNTDRNISEKFSHRPDVGDRRDHPIKTEKLFWFHCLPSAEGLHYDSGCGSWRGIRAARINLWELSQYLALYGKICLYLRCRL